MNIIAERGYTHDELLALLRRAREELEVSLQMQVRTEIVLRNLLVAVRQGHAGDAVLDALNAAYTHMDMRP